MVRKRNKHISSEEAREKQIIALAVDLAEKQLLEGTASSQVITHFLRLGSLRAQIEAEKLRQETELLRAKQEQLARESEIAELYAQAIEAMKTYRGEE